MSERWLPIAGYEGLYEISDRGRVRRLEYINALGHTIKQRVRKLSPLPSGYLRVTLSRDGVLWTQTVHRLVLEAFIGLPPEGAQACHSNGNNADNYLENLRYDTPKNNCADRTRHGRGSMMFEKGEAHPQAILTETEVREIRAWPHRKPGLHARFPHVARATVDHARCGRNWKTVE